jgi:hypothetical protein
MKVYRPGDKLTLHATVAAGYPNTTNILYVRINGQCINVRPEDVAAHEARAVRVGDWVENKRGIGPYKVIAMHKGLVWCESGKSGVMRVYAVDQLTPCEPPK